jgi:hypothetical protein
VIDQGVGIGNDQINGIKKLLRTNEVGIDQDFKLN